MPLLGRAELGLGRGRVPQGLAQLILLAFQGIQELVRHLIDQLGLADALVLRPAAVPQQQDQQGDQKPHRRREQEDRDPFKHGHSFALAASIAACTMAGAGPPGIARRSTQAFRLMAS